LIQGVDVPGYASLICTILFLGGLNMMTLGIFGEYLARVFIESKHRPLYVIRNVHRGDEVAELPMRQG
jgi:glycosyltransferase involved in cell wall biosynthesis